MRKGKVSQTVLKRSVLKNINSGDITLIPPGIGNDCGAVNIGNTNIAVSVSCASEKIHDKAFYGLMRVRNALASFGCEPAAVVVSITADESLEEKELKSFMKRLNDLCSDDNIAIMAGHTEISDKVQGMTASFTGIGSYVKTVNYPFAKTKTASVIMTKAAALEGTAMIAEERTDELSSYYYGEIVENALLFKKQLSILPEGRALINENVYMHSLSQGGILSGLWDICEKFGCGIEIDMKSIPVRQESIEICEYYSLDPYKMLSGGSMLIVTDEEEKITEILDASGICSAVIGHITPGNDRLLKCGDITSCLNRPDGDEIYKLF